MTSTNNQKGRPGPLMFYFFNLPGSPATEFYMVHVKHQEICFLEPFPKNPLNNEPSLVLCDGYGCRIKIQKKKTNTK